LPPALRGGPRSRPAPLQSFTGSICTGDSVTTVSASPPGVSGESLPLFASGGTLGGKGLGYLPSPCLRCGHSIGVSRQITIPHDG